MNEQVSEKGPPRAEPLGELHAEIVAGQAARTEFWKWKLILIAALGAVGLGVGVDKAAVRAPLVLACIPLVCGYVDIITRHLSIRSHAIAAWRLSRDPQGSDPFQEWEKFKADNLLGFWWLEDLAKYCSSAIANIAVALVGWRLGGTDGRVLVLCGGGGLILTGVVWLVGARVHSRIRSLQLAGSDFYSNGVRIHYVERGTGEPVVLIHGLTGSVERNWIKWGVFHQLSEDYRVIALDCRGHGKSQKLHETEDYGTKMCLDIVRLLGHLGVTKAHIVGYSMGGRITARLLVDHPEPLLTATIAGADVFGKEPPRRPDQKHYKDNDPEAIDAVRSSWEKLAVTSEEMRSVAVPVLVVCGTLDSHLGKSQELHRAMPKAQCVELEGATHLGESGAARQPEFVKTIREFIASHRRSQLRRLLCVLRAKMIRKFIASHR